MGPLKADTLLRFAEPEVVFRGPITFNYLVLVLIRYIIVVKLIKSVIANPTVGQRKEGLRPVRSPKSFSEAPSSSTISFYVNSVYNSSEIDKIRYCPPNRGTGGPTARVTMCPENLHRPGLTTPCGLRRAKVGFRTRHRPTH